MQLFNLMTFILLASLVSSQEEEATTAATTEEKATTGDDDKTVPPDWWHPSCRYYCYWNSKPYCCDDGTSPIPPDHEPHLGLACPPMEEHICKGTGIFVAQTTKEHKYEGVLPLAKGKPKELPVCASDGYCLEEERCCPSVCAGRHVCLLAYDRKEK